jgi:hypothetical protein
VTQRRCATWSWNQDFCDFQVRTSDRRHAPEPWTFVGGSRWGPGLASVAAELRCALVASLSERPERAGWRLPHFPHVSGLDEHRQELFQGASTASDQSSSLRLIARQSAISTGSTKVESRMTVGPLAHQAPSWPGCTFPPGDRLHASRRWNVKGWWVRPSCPRRSTTVGRRPRWSSAGSDQPRPPPMLPRRQGGIPRPRCQPCR